MNHFHYFRLYYFNKGKGVANLLIKNCNSYYLLHQTFKCSEKWWVVHMEASLYYCISIYLQNKRLQWLVKWRGRRLRQNCCQISYRNNNCLDIGSWEFLLSLIHYEKGLKWFVRYNQIIAIYLYDVFQLNAGIKFNHIQSKLAYLKFTEWAIPSIINIWENSVRLRLWWFDKNFKIHISSFSHHFIDISFN